MKIKAEHYKAAALGRYGREGLHIDAFATVHRMADGAWVQMSAWVPITDAEAVAQAEAVAEKKTDA